MGSKGKKDKTDDKQQRLSRALRENLKRRKQQARHRDRKKD